MKIFVIALSVLMLSLPAVANAEKKETRRIVQGYSADVLIRSSEILQKECKWESAATECNFSVERNIINATNKLGLWDCNYRHSPLYKDVVITCHAIRTEDED